MTEKIGTDGLRINTDKSKDLYQHYLALAREGRDDELDILVKMNEYPEVQRLVATHGRDKDLDILVHNENATVRREVAKHGRDKDLDILVYDPDVEVRVEVAKQGRDKDIDLLLGTWYVTNIDLLRAVAGLHRPQDKELMDAVANKFDNDILRQIIDGVL